MYRIKTIETSNFKRNITIRTTAILIALCFLSILFLFLGHNPFKVYLSMLEGSLGSLYRFKETLVRTIPLVIVSIGLGLSFRMKFWNIGGEGQIMMGAFGSTYFGLFHSHLPAPILLPLMGIAAMIGGGLWALIPAFFKVKFKTNETILTLMMNYVALNWLTYLQYVAWKDPEAFGYPKIPNLPVNAQLPSIFSLHIGILLVPVFVAGMYLFIRHTKKGYEIRVIGESESTALYAGMPVSRIILGTLFVSGAICGLVGMVQVSGVNLALNVNVTNGAGYTAIIISWLSQLNAIAMLIVSFLFAVMVEGGSYIQTVLYIPQDVAFVMQGLILFCVLGSEFFIRYRIVRSRKSEDLSQQEA